MTVEGSGQIIRNPGAASGCCPVTARFIAGTTCGPQEMVDSLVDILWHPPSDPFEEWDDIGFDPSDYSTTGSFYFGAGMDGVYLVNVFVAIDPAEPSTPGEGHAMITLSSGATFDEKSTVPLVSDHASDLIIAAGPRRFYEGQSFTVQVRLNGSNGVSTISPASIAFTRLLSL